VTMAEQQHLCTGGKWWLRQQELRWQWVAAVGRAAAAAALANGGG
jgi:hypothetical protein